MRVRRQQHHAVRLARELHVVDVARTAGEEALVLDPADRLSDSETVHLLGLNVNKFSRS
jgi:hypothetical protein